ncbi:MAG: SdrD B-like domain-containing protein, partial [Cyanobacteria bacterium J06636_27]
MQDGTYQVDFVRDGAVFETQNVTINGENEKVDAVIDAAPAPAAGKAKIVGNKWNDLNGDGIWDSNEAGLSGWTIYLDTNGNRQLDVGEVSTTTDANGEYVFNDIDPGTYNVAEVLQSGWVQTNPDPSNPIGSEAYQLDDGQLDRYRGGFTDGGGNSLELLALNTFDTQTGLETIDSISVGLGTNGNPSKVFIYNDPNNDGNPNDAIQLAEVNTSFTGTSGFGLVNLTTPVTVSGTFFVGALYAGGELAPVDEDSNAGQSSFIPGFSSGIDTNDLSNNFSAIPVFGNLLLRANSPGALPNIVTVAADETIANINFGNQEIPANTVPGTAARDTLVGASTNDEITGYQGRDIL